MRALTLFAVATWALALGASAVRANEAAAPGDAARGAALVASRSQGLCVLCHAVPGVAAPLQGNLAPSLSGVGARLSATQLRDRLTAPERFNPDTLMPSYRRSEGFARVAANRQGQALFTEAQVDDVVAYLSTLR
jgi:sulfur-oxidizing protein SoxX